MSNVTIKKAVESDLQKIVDFMDSHFVNSEPSISSHVKKDEKLDDIPPNLEMEALRTETLLLAYIGEELVGLLIATEETNEQHETKNEKSLAEKSKGEDIGDLLVYISKYVDQCNKLNVPRCLEVKIISTHSDHLRKGIAKKLFEAILETAKVKKFPAITVHCTSYYTAKIAQSFGMQCIAVLSYDDYNKKIGKVLFVPTEPHTEIRAYAMLLDNKN